ncbi:MAG: efflux RND transporter periplasmic adaptor subunit [Luteitalea sp.]|nr:efflux RND transporter periplasmic adaptor subunit [Luteitalea sp.]
MAIKPSPQTSSAPTPLFERCRGAVRSVIALTGLLLVACGPSSSSSPAAEDVTAAISVTRWTDKTELFAEYPPLVADQTSRFAIHLTRLDSFAPVEQGAVEVQLRARGSQPEAFRVNSPSRPGIFGVDVRPARPGRHALVILLRTAGLADEHHIGFVSVHANAGAASSPDREVEQDDAISFLKEQQWTLDFATEVVREEPVRASVRVPAEIVARPAGTADVAAPADGRLADVAVVEVGATVTKGDELARLLPAPAAPDQLPQLDRARAIAAASVELARRDRARAERLVEVGAAPHKRLEEARTAEEHATAQMRAAEASLEHYGVSRTGKDASADAGLFVLRSPIAGVIAARRAATGANVAAGSVLFQVVDASLVHVLGRIPEANAAQARRVRSAEIEVPGLQQVLTADRLVSVGKVLDPQSRTLPIMFVLDNRQLQIPVGQAVFLRLLMEETAPKAVVPTTAIVDDGGRPVVFVQCEGESFERRPVTLGLRAGNLVQVIEGVVPGERVVTKGAYLVRLASLSTETPAHGHVH